LLGPKFILTATFKNILKVFFIVLYDGLPIFAYSLACEYLFQCEMLEYEM